MTPRPRTGMRAVLTSLLRKAVILVVGSLLVLAGIAMIVLPGPGWLTVFAGLALLGREFAWAKRASERLRGVLERSWAFVQPHLRRLLRRPPVQATEAEPVHAPAPAAFAPDVIDLCVEGVPAPREEDSGLSRSCRPS